MKLHFVDHRYEVLRIALERASARNRPLPLTGYSGFGCPLVRFGKLFKPVRHALS